MALSENSRRSIITLTFLFASFIWVPVWGQSARQTSLIEGAKKEGALVWYTSMSADTAKPLVDGLEKKCPFLKVNFTRVAARK